MKTQESAGVRRIALISSCFTSWHRWALYFSLFLVAYAYGLDGSVRYTFQGYATAGFGQHSLLATVNVVRSIVAAAAQPAYAKISDVFGRTSILLICAVLYTVGTIVEATSTSVEGFSGGAILYQFGYTGILLLVEVLIADTTTLRNRLLASYIPALPFLVNAWVSGNVVAAIVASTTWHWGIGMWAIIFPACCIPLFVVLFSAELRAKRQGLLDDVPSPFRLIFKDSSVLKDLFWQTDLVGLVLLAATLALILLPFTLAGGLSQQWRTGKVIATLVVGGFVALPAFLVWEIKFARIPIIPFRLLKDRTILAGLVIAMFLNASWYLQGDYLYPVMIVAFNQSVLSATRISSLYSFCSVITGVILGLLVRYFRRLKYFIVAGTLLFMVAFGILIRYRGGEGQISGLIGGQILLGIAGGMFPYPTQALVQAATRHEHVAVITALYLASYNVGSALGFTISGAIWTQTLPGKLSEQLGPLGSTLAADLYADPYTFADTYLVGTPERAAAIVAYQATQRLLCITGICMSSVLVLAALCLRNYYLGDVQSRDDAEIDGSEISDDEERASNKGDHDRK